MKKNLCSALTWQVLVIISIVCGMCFLSSCFKKKNKAQESGLSLITVKAPQTEGISWNKIKFTAKASDNPSNQGKNCTEASVPEAGVWRNFSGAAPYATVSLTLGCEYNLFLGFSGKKEDGKVVIYEGNTKQVITKDKEGKSKVKIDIRENPDKEPLTVEVEGVEDHSPTAEPSSKTSK